ncbi:carboxypeptidase B-like [Spodoptera frugiperda]|uniref:Carboxypeptidase B-like n=1 Tax=Spodoptera frugiperda TaxID=7108 RepID=A0A9R0F2N3_SPOFR|nr:carboxypeptidase B-like [Spodoptera frugiperda]
MKWFVFIGILSVASSKHEKYIGWKSYYIKLSTAVQSKALGPMEQMYELDFLSHPAKGREGVVLVKPQHQAAFVKELDAEGIAYRIHVDNVKRKLDYDDQLIQAMKRATAPRNKSHHQLSFYNYHDLQVFEDYLDYIAKRYPKIATVVTGGYSFNNNSIEYIKISTTNFEDKTKPVVVIDGTIHAREWITAPTVAWAIHKLVENVTEPDLLDRFDWILVPIANPDGYKYSFDYDRFWRKNRSFDDHPVSFVCRGVDLNRNFDIKFNTHTADETYTDNCEETFQGTHAFSEPETRVIRDILQENLARVALYISLHSFGSVIMYPWGYDGTLSYNAGDLYSVGKAMAAAIDSNALPYFPRYDVGNIAQIMYRSTGASTDYAHSIGVPLAYAFELPGLSDTDKGFHLEPSLIKQVCQETWEGFVVGARRAGDLFPNKN